MASSPMAHSDPSLAGMSVSGLQPDSTPACNAQQLYSETHYRGHQSPTQPPWQPHSDPQNTMTTAFHYPECCGNHFLPPTTPWQPQSVKYRTEAATFHYPQWNGLPSLLTTVTWQPHSPSHTAMATTFHNSLPTPGSTQPKSIPHNAPAIKLTILAMPIY